jgi:co-chaperonin GroES (HSP10)
MVVVRRIGEDKKTAGIIIIPDTVKEKPMQGEIIAAGTMPLPPSGSGSTNASKFGVSTHGSQRR